SRRDRGDHPSPWRGGRDLRPRLRDVCRRGRRGGPGRRPLPPAGPPIHARFDRLRPGGAVRPAGGVADDPGTAARPVTSAGRLRLCRALPPCNRPMPQPAAAMGHARRRARRPLPRGHAMTALYDLADLAVDLPGGDGFLARSGGGLNILSGISLTLAPAETFAVVGESGSGKTTLARTMMGLIRPSGGQLVFAGHTRGTPGFLPALRQGAAMIFQDAVA